jgi:hypothetical protein
VLLNIDAKENTFTYSFSFVGMSMDYCEYDDNGDILDSEKSDFTDIIGFEIGLDYLFDVTAQDYSQVGFHLSSIGGKSVYMGSYLVDGSGYGSVVSSTNNALYDLDGEYLYGVSMSNGIDVLGGISLGFKNWYRELSPSQIEMYRWIYLNPKLGVKLFASQDIELRLMMGYKYGLNPIMTATGIQDDFKLGSANILHLALSTQYQIDQMTALTFEYLYENQVITKSNVVYGSDATPYLEPDSTANNQYMKFGVAFKY